MGQVLVATKALDVLTGLLFAWMSPFVTNVYNSTLTLYWAAFVYHIPLGDETAMPAIERVFSVEGWPSARLARAKETCCSP